MWKAVVLLPKGGKDYGVIDIVEVMWKLVVEILNRQLTASITFHDFLYRFRVCCSTGTATVVSKLIQQLADVREEVLYEQSPNERLPTFPSTQSPTTYIC